jgi:S-(hydroxymethyl)mycothiol dehydrogenase
MSMSAASGLKVPGERGPAGQPERRGMRVADQVDFVILNWGAVYGQCRVCSRGRPWHCFATYNAKQKMTLSEDTALSPALGIGAFSEKTLVAAGQRPKVEDQARGGGPAQLRRDGRARVARR